MTAWSGWRWPSQAFRNAILLLAYLFAWLMARPYRGLDHDGQLYAFQGLKRLEPGIFGNDLFVRFGSQDDFSLFPSLIALAISGLGLEHGAALVTLISYVGLIAASLWLATKLMPWKASLLAVGLVLVMPGFYGGYTVFRVTEIFLSARTLAEALVVAALALSLAGRWTAAFIVVSAAMLIHPLMALPGVLLLVALAVSNRHLAYLTFAGALTLAFVVAWATIWPIGPLSVVSLDWLEIIQDRSVFLFVNHWPTDDWYRIAVVFGTLVLTAFSAGDRRIPRLARLALLVGIGGLVVSTVASCVPVELLLKGQAWRWLWLPTLLAMLLLPWAAICMWADGAVGRASAAFMGLAWIVDDVAGLLLILFSVACWLGRSRIRPVYARLLEIGAVAAMVLMIGGLIGAITTLPDLSLGREPPMLEKVRNVFGLGGALFLFVVVAWFAAQYARRRILVTLVSLFLAFALPLAVQSGFRVWTAAPMAAAKAGSFGPWIQAMPPHAEVLWVNDPLAVWFILGRPSYLSSAQAAGVVFSRATAMEVDRRSQVLAPLVDPDWIVSLRSASKTPVQRITPSILQKICIDSTLGFVVSDQPVSSHLPPVEWPVPGKRVWLYDCRDSR